MGGSFTVHSCCGSLAYSIVYSKSKGNDSCNDQSAGVVNRGVPHFEMMQGLYLVSPLHGPEAPRAI